MDAVVGLSVGELMLEALFAALLFLALLCFALLFVKAKVQRADHELLTFGFLLRPCVLGKALALRVVRLEPWITFVAEEVQLDFVLLADQRLFFLNCAFAGPLDEPSLAEDLLELPDHRPNASPGILFEL